MPHGARSRRRDCTLKSHRDTVSTREVLIRRGVWLEIGTVAWNAGEGIIAVAAGIVASSVALVGFGVDSFVETTSGAVVGWRLRAELVGQLDKEHVERLERRAGRTLARFCSASRSTSWWTLVGASSGLAPRLMRAGSGWHSPRFLRSSCRSSDG